MNEKNYKEIVKSAPYAYAYHKVVLDDNNNPTDYVFLDVNKAFEEQTGLFANNIINKTAKEILPGIEKSNFNWISFYGEIALNGGSHEFEQYSEPLSKYYKIIAYSFEKYYFITVFIDITEDKINSQKNVMRLKIIDLSDSVNSELFLTNALDYLGTAVSSPISFFVQIDENNDIIDAAFSKSASSYVRSKTKIENQKCILNQSSWNGCVKNKKVITDNKSNTNIKNSIINKEICVPVIRNGKVKVVVGIANKKLNYSQHEITILKYFSDICFSIYTRKKAEESLEELNNYTQRVNKLMRGREDRIIELKKEVNKLSSELGRKCVYKSVAD